MTASRPRALVAALALALLSASCTGDTIAPVRSSSAPARSQAVDIAQSDAVLMVRTPTAPVGERGETSVQLDAGIFNKKGKVHPHKQEKFYEWVTSDPSVATVDSTGRVTAVGVGRAFIIVDYKDMADTMAVSVIPVPVASITAAGPDSLSLADTATYMAAALDSVGEPLLGRVITWTSSNPAALTIGASDGIAVANAVGTAIITATSETKSAEVTTKVWLQPVATIEVVPATQSIALYRSGSFSAVLKDRRGVVLTGRTITWRSTATGVFTIDGTTGAVTTVTPGTASAVAESEGRSGTGTLVVTNPVEARVLWVTRFDFNSAADVVTIIAKAKAARFNMVYFQVRASGDAFYKSTIEPCAVRVCTTLGGPNMKYDPLGVALAEAANPVSGPAIEVHAWLNSMTAWSTGTVPTGYQAQCDLLYKSSGTPVHLAVQQPSYILTASNGTVTPCATSNEYMWFSPGVPQVRTRLAKVAAELLRNYPGLKGIHLDRIRYPGTAWSYDTASVNAYKRANGGAAPVAGSTAWANFRRGFVNAAVKEVHDTIQAMRPAVVLSAAVWPIYKLPGGWPSNCCSKGFDDLFQDTRAWTGTGYLDVAAPMTYPASAASGSYTVKNTYCAVLDWECLYDDHRAVIEKQHHRHVYIGVGAIKGWPEMDRQIAIARRTGATGIAVYSYGTMQTYSPTAWANLTNGYFRYPATIPAMPWK